MLAGNDEEGIVYVMAAKQAVVARLRCIGTPYPIFSASSLPTGVAIALAGRALAFVSRDPEFDVSSQATPHVADPADPIVNGGAISAPVQLFAQSDLVGVRFRMWSDWALRDPRGVAWTENVSW